MKTFRKEYETKYGKCIEELINPFLVRKTYSIPNRPLRIIMFLAEHPDYKPI